MKKPYIKPEILVEEWKVYKITNSCVLGRRVYEVSNFGRVKINGILIDFDDSKPSYYIVGHFYVHRAVAELFIPNPENKPEIDHIDNNKHNNIVTNLRWVTHKENCNNSLTRQQRSETINRPEVKQKQRESMREYWSNPENRQERKGEKSYWFGKHHTEESKQKQKKPKPKYLWLTENGDQIWMDPSHVAMHHKDWKLISKTPTNTDEDK